MNEIDMWVDQPWFDYLVSGKKPVEGRKASPTWAEVKKGDVLKMQIEEDGKIKCAKLKVDAVHEYLSLEDYLLGEGIEKCLPGIETLEEAVEIYKQWSTDDELKKYKFLGICVEHI